MWHLLVVVIAMLLWSPLHVFKQTKSISTHHEKCENFNVHPIGIQPLHINLGLINKFPRAAAKDGIEFLYLKEKFPKFSGAKMANTVDP